MAFENFSSKSVYMVIWDYIHEDEAEEEKKDYCIRVFIL